MVSGAEKQITARFAGILANRQMPDPSPVSQDGPKIPLA